mgnify:FL=1
MLLVAVPNESTTPGAAIVKILYAVNGYPGREPFIRPSPLGEFTNEQVYTSSMVELEDGSLRFYSHKDVREHRVCVGPVLSGKATSNS